MRRFTREQSLSIFFGVLFFAALVGQAIAGHADYNNEQLTHQSETISIGRYLTSSAFDQAVLENWQSEYLQFMLFMLATAWFVTPRSPRWARVGGLRTAIYNAEQAEHDQAELSLLQFIGTAHFWEATLQNWQSEFLAVGSFVVLTIYLRQRGSPESKPVGAPHDATGIAG